MAGDWPDEQIDHLSHARDDNSWANLREASHQENQRNRSKSCNNTSGITGVVWNKAARKWQARIKLEGEFIYLGTHKDFNAAVLTRKVAEFAYGFHPNHGKAISDDAMEQVR
jgi:hypothetical protein